MTAVGGPTNTQGTNTVAPANDADMPKEVGTDANADKLKGYSKQELAARIRAHHGDLNEMLMELGKAKKEERAEKKAERKAHRAEKKAARKAHRAEKKQHRAEMKKQNLESIIKMARPKLYKQHVMLEKLKKELQAVQSDLKEEPDPEVWGKAREIQMAARNSRQRTEHLDQQQQRERELEGDIEKAEQKIKKMTKGGKLGTTLDWV